MNAPSQTPILLRFEAFEADLRSRELRKDGVKVKLQDQPFQLLALLLEHPGEVITRDDLRQKLWPADTFVGFDDSLNTAIKKVRDALGDSAEKPRVIETLPKQGYRFILPVNSMPTEPSSSGSTRSPAAATGLPQYQFGRNAKFWSARRAILLATLSAAVLLASTYFLRQRVRPEPKPTGGKVMLAVLPFENLSGEPEQEFFSDGMTEEMITQLGSLEPASLGVIARTSSLQYKHSIKGINQIGQDLGVQYVLEGSVRKAGDRLRITAQLIQVSDQTHLWAQSYDRDVRDVLAIQADVARSIAREISLKLTAEQQQKLAVSQQVDPVAYGLYLSGRYHMGQNGLPQAIEDFQRAIEKQPDYALGYSGLADCYTMQAFWGWKSPQQVLPEAKTVAEKALALDSSLGEAHASLATIDLYSWDFVGAEREFKRALELNPSNASARHEYSHLLVALGRWDESLAETKRGIIFDPLDGSLQAHLGFHYYYARQYELGIPPVEAVLKTHTERPRRPLQHSILAGLYEETGKYDKAIAEFRAAIEQSNGLPVYLAQLAHAQAISGDKSTAIRTLDELKRLSNQKYVPPDQIAAIYVSLGQNETGFEWLERAYRNRSAFLINLNVDPRFDGLHQDPRFSDLVRRIGLVPITQTELPKN